MYTTNMASRSDPATYTALVKECEALVRIAKEMESFAINRPSFSTDPNFDDLKKRFQPHFQNVVAYKAYNG
jgi:hypothetical protein